jgi:uncharacterized membrane protein
MRGVGPSIPRRLIWFAAVIALLLLLLPLAGLDGKAHGGWLGLLGRLHPLAVHLPIGLLVILPGMEIAGRRRAALREAAGVLLGAAAVCSVAAALLGLMLAHSGGFTRAAVTKHMWGGVWLAVAVIGCLLLRPLWVSGRGVVYPWLLGATLLLLGWASHQGGSLVYGPNYLSENLPQPLRGWFTTVVPKPLVAGSVFATKVYPILDAKCVECHGPNKTEGGLRLDAYEYLVAGGSDGAVVVAGHPETSLLLHRVMLPATDKKFMPAEGKPPLAAEEIAVIRAWIAAGASATAMGAGQASAAKMEAPVEPVGDYSGLMRQMETAAMALNVRLVPVSMHASDGLILRTIDAGRSFDDAKLGQLAPFAPYIVDAELGQSGVTDASFATLGKFAHLRELHLEGTAVTGRGIEALKGLRDLRYINLTETKVSKDAVDTLKTMPGLEHVYLYNTPAQPAEGQAAR